jgi:hypothetical protein
MIHREKQTCRRQRRSNTARSNQSGAVDVSEPIDFFNQLSQAGVTCDRGDSRRLATFDFIWMARRSPMHYARHTRSSLLSDMGCERKEIIDLVNSLNAKNKSTGLVRTAYQKLKETIVVSKNKVYIVQEH